MAEKEPGLINYLLALLFSIVFITGYTYLFGGDVILSYGTSQDTVFHVDLQKDKNYELWVIDMNGPEKAEISIRKGSYIAYQDTFRLLHPEGDYLPYDPGFTVKESGTYDVVVHIVDHGKLGIQVRQDTGINPSRIIRDIQNSPGQQ